MRAGIWLFALVLLLAAGTSHAHSRSQSFSTWQVDEGTHLSGIFTIDSRRATLLYAEAPADDPLPAVLSAHLAETVTATQGGVPCDAVRPPRPQSATPGFMRVALHFECPQPVPEAGVVLQIEAFSGFAATHVHVAQISTGEGRSQQTVLSPSRTQLVVAGESQAAPAEGWFAGFQQFVTLGMTHVLSGLDHLVFLAALILLTRRVRELVLTITGFTLGHSLTLGLSVIGVLEPSPPVVEAVIGFSIVYAALEAARRSALVTGRTLTVMAVALGAGGLLAWIGGWLALPMLALVACLLMLPAAGCGAGETLAWRAPLVATVFGLVHGAGFAGELLGLSVPKESLVTALLGFNVGVEMGQLAAIAVVFGVWLLAGAGLRMRLAALQPATLALLVGIGMFWLAGRSLAF